MNFDVFATRLNMLRSSRRLTLRQVGDAVRYSLQAIGNLENGRLLPSLNVVLLLANFFDVSIDYLIGRKDNNNVCRNGTCNDHIDFRSDNIENEALRVNGRKVLNLNVFAPRLRGLRLAGRLTLRNVGDAVGCHMKTIGNLENANKTPSLSVMLALADFFGVSVDYLAGWTSCKTDANDSGGKTVKPSSSSSAERKKLIELIKNLHGENIGKALSYVTFLSEQQCKDKNSL